MLIKGGPFEKGPPFLFSFLMNLLPVCQKLLDTHIGQRVLNQLLHHLAGLAGVGRAEKEFHSGPTLQTKIGWQGISPYHPIFCPQAGGFKE